MFTDDWLFENQRYCVTNKKKYYKNATSRIKFPCVWYKNAVVLLYKRVVLVGAHRVPRAIELQTWVREILLNLLTSVIYIYIDRIHYIVPTNASEVTTQTSCLYYMISVGLYLYISLARYIYDCITRVYILLYLSQKQYRIECTYLST